MKTQKQFAILLFTLLFTITLNAQLLETTDITDWNTMRKSGFFESLTGQSKGLPDSQYNWYWGLNIAHTRNATSTGTPYYYGGQLVFGNLALTTPPAVFVRSTNVNGQGVWAKLLHDQGEQTINGNAIIKGALTLQDNLILKTGTETLTPLGTYGKKLYFGTPWDNSDDIWMARYNKASDVSELRMNIGDDIYDKFVIGRDNNAEKSFEPLFTFLSWGRLGIRTDNPQYPLDVKGTIHATEVIIDTNFPVADYVFRSDYKLMPLHEVEQFVKTNNHLPEIPSAAQVEQNGMNLGEMQNKLLQKIEELTLYVIEQNKELQKQNKQVESQREQLEKQSEEINILKQQLKNK